MRPSDARDRRGRLIDDHVGRAKWQRRELRQLGPSVPSRVSYLNSGLCQDRPLTALRYTAPRGSKPAKVATCLSAQERLRNEGTKTAEPTSIFSGSRRTRRYDAYGVEDCSVTVGKVVFRPKCSRGQPSRPPGPSGRLAGALFPSARARDHDTDVGH